MIQGVNEQQDFSKGLNTITAIDEASRPFNLIRGERLSPSQVCVGGNSRKSRDTIRVSITTKWGAGKIMLCLQVFSDAHHFLLMRLLDEPDGSPVSASCPVRLLLTG
jgi:hypothetical protein